MNAPVKVRFADRPPSQQAGILCGKLDFRAFLAKRFRIDVTPSTSFAAEAVRRHCQVESRAKLDTDSEAALRWEILRTDYDIHRGAIATPR
ncbi:MAG: hypothetical protein MK098_15425, partial [Marinovum sp.]|nr:hypothetical protein [Marinovum sp.]